jgi:hypothetical protein
VTTVLSPLERRIGRPLTPAERHVEVEQINDLYDRAKDLLTLEIQREQKRLATVLADGDRGSLEATPRMLSILRTLRRHGSAHAKRELHSMGHKTRPPARAFAVSDDHLDDRLRHSLAELTVKIEDAAVSVSLGEAAADAIQRAAIAVLGARSIAADLIAPAFDAGLADTFENHPELQFQYSAVLDSATCDPCSSLDGDIYASWAAIQEALPDGGPNPDCDGGDRCRCRPVPVPA